MKVSSRVISPVRQCYRIDCLRMRSFLKTIVQLTVLCLATVSNAGTAIHYVDPASTAPQAPYLSWGTAAVTIQQAIDSAAAGDEIVVTNGTYATGGRALADGTTNRLAVDKPVTVHSVNGPQFTVIEGGVETRCVSLVSGASLSGFTLTKGASGNSGGGVWCESATAILSNCVLVGNSALGGGGVAGGTLRNCTLSNNVAYIQYVGHGGTIGGLGGGAYNSTLNGCTLSANRAADGGGAFDCTLNNCTLTNNYAYTVGAFPGVLTAGYGGGASSSTLNNCLLNRNTAAYGGGASSSTVNNCTLTGNSAILHPPPRYVAYPYGGSCGGAVGSTLNNCVVYFNQATEAPNYDSSSSLNYCCTTPQPASGIGNFSADPQLASASHLGATSPCRGTGNAAYASGTDIDGEAWASPPAIGCDEYRAGSVTGAVTVGIGVAYTNVAPMYPLSLTGFIDGPATRSMWDFGDGLQATNQPFVTHAWTTAGDYEVVLRAYNEDLPGGISSTVTVHVASQSTYVAADSPNPQPPYSSWETAARVLQDAVDAAGVGAIVLVTNGLYATGGRAVAGLMTNRVVVDKPVTLRSVNGPQFTVIRGHQVPGTTNGDGAIRCVYLASGASLSGFTLSSGATLSGGNYVPVNDHLSGGGLWCEFPSAVVSNCWLIGNSAYSQGGGAFYARLENCLLSGNSVTADNGFGGGASHSVLHGCLLTTNTATAGGGAGSSKLNNCVVTGNVAVNGSGGIADSSANNCIVYFNTSANCDFGWMYSCCTTPLPAGANNFTNAPLFVDLDAGNLRLQSNSPCINAGLDAEVSQDTDLDGNPRIVGAAVDVGAYEFQSPASVISYVWLQNYTLPTDGSADYLDSDADGLNNWQEWRCRTDPKDALSLLRLLPATPNGGDVVVSWPGAAGVSYVLERSTGLTAHLSFMPAVTNFSFYTGTMSFTDTNAATAPGLFYRVRVDN